MELTYFNFFLFFIGYFVHTPPSEEDDDGIVFDVSVIMVDGFVLLYFAFG